MKTRSTIFLLLLACGLAFFIWRFERHTAGSRESEKGGPLLKAAPGSIDGIELTNLGGTIKLKLKSDGAWYITEPINDRADPAVVKQLLLLAGDTKVSDSLESEDSKSERLATYGLDDKSAVRVQLRAGGKIVERLKVGLEGPIPEMMYVLLPEEKPNRVRIAQPNLRGVLCKTATEMRDPWVFRQRPGTVERAAWRRGDREIEVSRQLLGDDQATPWMVVKPLKIRALQKELDEYVAALAGTAILSFAPPNANQQPSGTPLAELTLWGKGGKKGSAVRFFTDPESKKVPVPKIPGAKPEAPDAPEMQDETVLAWIVDRKTLVKLDSDMLYGLPDKLDYVRTHTLADLNYDAINTILIEGSLAEGAGRKIVMHRVQKRWFLQGEGTMFYGANSTRIAKMIQDLNAAQILDFTTDTMVNPADYGLDKPLISVTFASGINPSLKEPAKITPENSVTLRLGEVALKKAGSAEGEIAEKRLYANFLGEPSVYLVSPEYLYSLVDYRWIKWRNLTVGTLSRNSVRRVVHTIGAEPPVELSAARRSLQFTATRAGADVTKLLSEISVEHLLGKLGNFQASEWAVGLQEGLEALKDPVLQIELDLEDWNADKAEFVPRHIKYWFAPTSKNVPKPVYYFGRSSEMAEIFIVERDVFLELAQPLLDRAKQDADPVSPENP